MQEIRNLHNVLIRKLRRCISQGKLWSGQLLGYCLLIWIFASSGMLHSVVWFVSPIVSRHHTLSNCGNYKPWHAVTSKKTSIFSSTFVTSSNSPSLIVHEKFFSSPMPPHVPYGLRGLPSRLWPKCNRLLRLGRPWGAVTLSRWGGWWYMNMK
jgi:hypothetical protein